MKSLRPFILLACFILLIGIACNAITGGSANPTDTVQEDNIPTEEVLDSAPTEAPSVEDSSAPDFFTDEFDDFTDWTYFYYGSETKNKFTVENGKATFEINEADGGFEIYYDPYNYSDVRIDVSVENRGRNTINITLLCRATDENGYYQAVITSDGRYAMFAYDKILDKKNRLGDGGSKAINIGKAVNQYGLSCVGNTITLFINGETVKEAVDTQVGLSEGQVGMYVGPIRDILPVVVDLDWFSISQP